MSALAENAMTVHHYFHILIIKSSYWTQTYFLNSTGGIGMMWLFQLGTNRDCDGNKRSLLPVNDCVSHLKHVSNVFAGLASFDHVVQRLFFFHAVPTLIRLYHSSLSTLPMFLSSPVLGKGIKTPQRWLSGKSVCPVGGRLWVWK